MQPQFYVAYGSNLNFRQMAWRCPTARLHGKGLLEDYQLQFKGASHSSFATVAPDEGCVVPVAVWKIQPEDERALDRYEGYPNHYFKQDVTVMLDDGEEVLAMIYVMNLQMDYGMPSNHYYNTVLQGYHDCGFSPQVLEQALANSTQRMDDYIVECEAKMEEDFHDEPQPGTMQMQWWGGLSY
jgi:hypothetical protein